jgi:hypothetical protein
MSINYEKLKQHWYRQQKAKLIKAGFSVVWSPEDWLYVCYSPSGLGLFTDEDEDYLWTFLIDYLRNAGELEG